MNPPGSSNKNPIAKLFQIKPDKTELSISDKVYDLSFTHHPWFQNQNQIDLENVEEIISGHFHWPCLDVNLTENMILFPDKYPHLAKFQNAQLYDKLDFLPENITGEIIEGKLILSPRPANKHISASSYLGALALKKCI